MTFKIAHWEPELPLPRNADRKTLAAIITHHYFPISHRTQQTWPLTVRRPNRASVYDVQEAMAHAGVQVVFAKEGLPLCAGELKTLVGMDHHLLFWFAPPNSSQQCL